MDVQSVSWLHLKFSFSQVWVPLLDRVELGPVFECCHSDARQPSREVAGLAYDKTRPKDRQGNSLFTYALLKALTTDESILSGDRSPLVSVRVLGLANYFDSVFFNAWIKDGEAARLMKRYSWPTFRRQSSIWPALADLAARYGRLSGYRPAADVHEKRTVVNKGQGSDDASKVRRGIIERAIRDFF